MRERPLSIVVPTYREAESLPVLLPRVLEMLRETGLDGEVLIIDDDSADGTAEVCQPFVEAGGVSLHVRKDERGLAGAVLHGFDLATGETVVVMDADLSHPPEAIPRLLMALESGADMALGSRYVSGGSTADAWTAWRWVNSKVATLFAWPLTKAHDPMAGFLAIRRQRVMDARQRLNPVGYKIALELIVKCRCKVVREVPIRFEDRVYGESKLNFREQVNYLRHILRLYRYCLARKLGKKPNDKTPSDTESVRVGATHD